MVKMNISYSYGMVDLMHFGHISALQKASVGSDLSIFGLVSDEASDAWFGTHVSSENERRAVLESIKYINEVWPQETFDPIDNLRKLHRKYPDAIITLFTGNEWGVIAARKYVESIGGKVVKIDYYDKLSPEMILATLNKKDTEVKFKSNNLISTKANTLQSLKEKLTKSHIEDMFVCTVGEFIANEEKIFDEICKVFVSGKIVVRSSSKREDAFEESNAGHFTSVLNVIVSDKKGLRNAISEVISSYGDDIENDEQVLIQRQTENVVASGVIFTRDIQKNRPYYVINYDNSGSTDTVTSGIGGATAWISYTVLRENVPERWKKLMEAVWEIENILPGVFLDIEFAITTDDVVIFQVRPLAAAYKFYRQKNDHSIEVLKNEAILKYRKRENTGLTCFSDMAFWNPAEIIGDNPKNLDFSLYREIITKLSWNVGLVSMGYRAVPKELMYKFGNKPYISVERSFEALIPGALPDELATKLTRYYVEVLKRDLSAHDKIEFEISHNCFDFSLNSRLAQLMMDGFSPEEVFTIENALKILTLKVISTYHDTLTADLVDLKCLEGIRLDIQNIVKGSRDFRLVAKSVSTLLEAINKYGTPQFARHARCAFIAKSICKSLVVEGYINCQQYNDFMSGIRTIAVDYDEDYHEVISGHMNIDDFRLKYGHLRAGTYNIRSSRYDQMNKLFSDRWQSYERSERAPQELDGVFCLAIDKAMERVGFTGVSGEEVVSFIKIATEQREYFKYIFTKSLSFAIELIKSMGNIADIPLSDLSYLELPEVYAAEYYSDVERLHEFWSLIIDKRRGLYKSNSELILPAVICSEKDFTYIEHIKSRPNYITENCITGEVVVLDDENEKYVDGKIVVIEKADPGYDWIFSKGIVGLVTKYGGAASHMAIRCAEFKVPAAIGCGESIYEYVVAAKKLTIDCKKEKLIREE
ncbi:Phosphoenolpyruvate synthase / Pyruvate phosphate dikinase [Anaerovibrio sp. JC8]|uniref:PEP-utilizing enzyme n=1 Tax=Anaerovibrio sp. JC8 TaxID=1240085 RepID=UPI000A0B0424|nr:PEP-utilizing enzyme [Anaerovibrio sp. JC8]ORU01419.1 Phosphoenolpyruvate synthase / Pyruvate phosphate dikinase [Anaerovibrio sp. JC8]